MAAPRLTFLYPILFRPTKIIGGAVIKSARKARRQSTTPAHFSTASRRRQEVAQQRYGTANEPLPPISGKNESAAPDSDAAKPRAQAEPPLGKEANEKLEEKQRPPTDQEVSTNASASSGESNKQTVGDKFTPEPEPESVEPLPADPPPTEPPPGSVSDAAKVNAMETVLQMPSPTEEAEQRPPHLQAPPYVHHFDTWGLVRRLVEGGYTQEQAVTTMKAVRGILGGNMQLARDGLVSKSNVENETYLFRAACSELRTEISNNRKAEGEKMRIERTHLQHEVDILSQRMGQELAGLKEEMKGMFEDRKQSVRMEQKNMDGKIQQLNNKITVALNSDARSDVEGLRWVLTRRAAMALAICSILILTTLRYNSYMSRTQEVERKQMAAEGAGKEVSEGGDMTKGSSGTDKKQPVDANPKSTDGIGEMMGGDAVIASKGGEGGYVSLG